MAKPVLEKNEADKIAISYTPRKFPVSISKSARSFQSLQEARGEGDFHIDRIVAQQSGIGELERLSIEERVEREALEKLKEIQESAYQSAYDLGFDEGREKAYVDQMAVLQEHLARFDGLIENIIHIKSEMVTFNEAHFVKLIYFLASKIAYREIVEVPGAILPILKDAVAIAQSEEQITIRLAKSDMEFIEQVRARIGNENEALKTARFEESENMQPGGCLVETNYGVVDATIEQRVKKLWEALAEKVPRSKDRAGGEG